MELTAERRIIHERVAKLLEIRNERDLEHKLWTTPNIEVGYFTYGIPNVQTWGENAKLHIGKFCSIGKNVQIMMGGEHHTEWCTTYPFNVLMGDYFGASERLTKTKGDVWIGNDVWIGQDAKILSGVSVGDGAVIAGSAVVTDNVRPYTVVGGVPAKKLYDRFLIGRIHKLMDLAWWDWPMEKIAEALPLLSSNDVWGLDEFSKSYDGREQQNAETVCE